MNDLWKSPVLLEQVIEKTRNLGLLIDDIGSMLFILVCLYKEEYDVLDTLDQQNTDKRVLLVYKNLELKGLIQPSDHAVHFELTTIGIEFITWILELYSINLQEALLAKPVSVTEKNTIDWIDDYIDLWPVKSRQGYFLRGDKKAISKKLERFLEEYPYTKELIFEATKHYIDERQNYNLDYIKKISNFIYHTDVGPGKIQSSDLAVWCENTVIDTTQQKQRDEVGIFNTFI